jgi:hypothetical protein
MDQPQLETPPTPVTEHTRSAVDPVSVPDPRDVELTELRRYRDEASATFERLTPHQEYIRDLVEDEDYRAFATRARETYLREREAQRAASKPVLDPAAQAVVDAFYAKFQPELEYVGKLRERETPEYQASKAAEAATAEFTRSNTEYAQRLMAEEGLTHEDVMEISAYAKALHDRTVAAGTPRFVGLEEAWRKMTSRAAKPERTAAPRSLRAHAATPGIPGTSKAEPPDRKGLAKPGGFTGHMLKALQAQRKGA